MDFTKITAFTKKNYIAILIAVAVVVAAVYYYKMVWCKKTEGFEDVVDYQLAQVHPVEKGCGCLASYEEGSKEQLMLMDITPYDTNAPIAPLQEVYEPATEEVAPVDAASVVVNVNQL